MTDERVVLFQRLTGQTNFREKKGRTFVFFFCFFFYGISRIEKGIALCQVFFFLFFLLSKNGRSSEREREREREIVLNVINLFFLYGISLFSGVSPVTRYPLCVSHGVSRVIKASIFFFFFLFVSFSKIPARTMLIRNDVNNARRLKGSPPFLKIQCNVFSWFATCTYSRWEMSRQR